MQNSEDIIEGQVRRRLADALQSRGWAQDQIALEVLYWLPPVFLNWYRDTYMKSLNLVASTQAKSGAGQGTTGDEAAVKAKVAGKYKGKRVGAGVGGAGKRWVEPPRVIKDEKLGEVLGRVNRLLERIGESQGRLGEQVGRIVKRDIAGRRRRVCDECGKFMKDEFLRCPYHEV